MTRSKFYCFLKFSVPCECILERFFKMCVGWLVYACRVTYSYWYQARSQGGCSGGSSTPFVSRTNTTIDGIDKHQNRKDSSIIGASLSEPHTYRTVVQNPLYIYVPFDRGLIWSREGPLLINAQRANVGPASNDSKVNNIALKTATLVLRFSWRSSLSTEQLL